jgi:hypothetical protein
LLKLFFDWSTAAGPVPERVEGRPHPRDRGTSRRARR